MLNHSPKQPCNHLGGKKWIKYSISIWDDLQKSREEQQLQHPAIFPVSLAKRVVEVWSREGELVFDPFVGSGSTLIAAAQLKRRGLGIDLSPEYIELAQKRLLELKGALPWKLYRDDALNLSRYLQEESADLCLTSPPYWDMLQARRTADHKV
ncbi:MAG: DNA methyltransferase, partial [Firmicutes bacterium]|nr:DNA methyltransferase [Bacillota bacterium]